MDMIASVYSASPFWIWLAFAALLLAVVAAFGLDMLLWPAASAAVVGVISLLNLPMGFAGEVVIFAALTLVTTLTSKRLAARVQGEGEDINDRASRLVGQSGEVVHAGDAGRLRVFVDGAEWSAEPEGSDPLPQGARVTVTGVSGATLVVRAE